MRVAFVVDVLLQVEVGRVAEYRDFFQWRAVGRVGTDCCRQSKRKAEPVRRRPFSVYRI